VRPAAVRPSQSPGWRSAFPGRGGPAHRPGTAERQLGGRRR
jgi:hypothetical protein